MSRVAHAHPTDLRAWLEERRRKTLLRFITCGSVDDGKSTLIGRLLHDGAGLLEDQLAALKKDTTRFGTTGGFRACCLFQGGVNESIVLVAGPGCARPSLPNESAVGRTNMMTFCFSDDLNSAERTPSVVAKQITKRSVWN